MSFKLNFKILRSLEFEKGCFGKANSCVPIVTHFAVQFKNENSSTKLRMPILLRLAGEGAMCCRLAEFFLEEGSSLWSSINFSSYLFLILTSETFAFGRQLHRHDC